MMMKTNFLSQLINRFKSGISDSLDGSNIANFYHRNTSNRRNFKPSQRQEKATSRHRKMKPNSR